MSLIINLRDFFTGEVRNLAASPDYASNAQYKKATAILGQLSKISEEKNIPRGRIDKYLRLYTVYESTEHLEYVMDTIPTLPKGVLHELLHGSTTELPEALRMPKKRKQEEENPPTKDSPFYKEMKIAFESLTKDLEELIVPTERDKMGQFFIRKKFLIQEIEGLLANSDISQQNLLKFYEHLFKFDKYLSWFKKNYNLNPHDELMKKLHSMADELELPNDKTENLEELKEFLRTARSFLKDYDKFNFLSVMDLDLNNLTSVDEKYQIWNQYYVARLGNLDEPSSDFKLFKTLFVVLTQVRQCEAKRLLNEYRDKPLIFRQINRTNYELAKKILPEQVSTDSSSEPVDATPTESAITTTRHSPPIGFFQNKKDLEEELFSSYRNVVKLLITLKKSSYQPKVSQSELSKTKKVTYDIVVKLMGILDGYFGYGSQKEMNSEILREFNEYITLFNKNFEGLEDTTQQIKKISDLLQEIAHMFEEKIKQTLADDQSASM